MARKKYAFHPACKLFPRLPDDELQALADDIAANGLKNAIVTLDGKILDGRNRLAACELANVEPRFTVFDGDDPIAWVVSQNLLRRHLTASQKAVVAHDLLPLLEKVAKGRQRRSNEYRGNGRLAQKCANRNSNGKASEAAARIVGTNPRYVEMVKSIKTKAPELIDEIRAGRLTVNVADRLAENHVRRNGRKGKRIRATENDSSRIFCGDCFDLIPKLDDESVQLVVTSPPYAEQRKQYEGVAETDYPAWTVKWMELVWDKLTDDGSVLIIIRPHIKRGQLSDYVLRTRLALREDGWTECEELIWLKPTSPPLGSTRRPRRSWESILWFSKSGSPYCNLTACGNESSRIGFAGAFRFGVDEESPVGKGQNMTVKNGTARCRDVFAAGVGENEPVDHPAMFPSSLAEQLILTFSRDGDLVVDPFCGAGSSLVAAKHLARDFRGFDISRKYVRIAQERLAEVGLTSRHGRNRKVGTRPK